MNTPVSNPRRSFLGKALGSAALASLPFIARRAAAQTPAPDAWISDVKGAHRCLFDFPQHKNFAPQMHILNFLNTYATAFKLPAGQAGAVGTFYSIGNQSSIPLAFNDAMWAKYGLGEYMNLKDAAGKPYVRNVFNRPTKDDAHLLMQAMQTPPIPAMAEGMAAMGIENLQKMGTKFLLCANAFGGWCLELEARGKGKAAEIQKELSANILPGVTVVPAMVIAIEQAQAAGIRYNRQ